MLMRISLVHTFDNMEVINTFGYETGDGTIPQDVADSLGADFDATTWMAGRSNTMSLTSIRVEDDTPGLAATGEYVYPTPVAGDDTGNAAPPLCALVVQWKGSGKGRAGRGRMFLTGYPAATAVAGFWEADAQTPASAAASVIFDMLGPAGTGQLCIINRVAGGVKLDPHTNSLVKAFSIDNVVRRIGRREAGKGS